jgi:curli production assembly/transport component CsgE
MKFCTLLALYLAVPVAFAIEPNFEIGGLIIDETLSRVGHLYYEEFVSSCGTSKLSRTISVHERFDPFAGNVIWIDVGDETLYQDRIGMRATGIDEKAQSACDTLKSYLQQHKDIY